MTTTLQMDHLDRLAASAFEGYLVRKDLVRKYARQYPVPTYVVEFLLGRYCATTDEDEIAEGLEIVEKQLRGRTVRTGDEELFKAEARNEGSVKLIDNVRAKLDAKNDCYVAELPSLALRDVQIGEVGRLLRREGLYSSHLTTWRKAAHTGSLKALSKKRGRKAKRNPLEEKVRKLERRNARLEEELRKAHLIIDVQGKVAGLLGLSLEDGTNS